MNKGLLILGNDLKKERVAVEARILRRYCPGFKLYANKKGGKRKPVKLVGDIKIRNRRYGLKVIIPDRYPYNMPRILPSGWKPSDAPHRYSDGSLCIMQSNQWNISYSLALVVKKATVWVHKYLKWKRTRQWPGRAQD